MSFARVLSAQAALPNAQLVSVEADVGRGLHQFSIVGLPDKAVEESRDRVSSAIKNSGFKSPKQSNLKIVISLAPATLKKEGGVFDIPIAISYLIASGTIQDTHEKLLFVGELALDGTVRPIQGALSLAQCAHKEGLAGIVVPQENADEAALIENISVYPIKTLSELIQHLTTQNRIQPHTRSRRRTNTPTRGLDDIRGQEHAKRALEIAAAGEHNIAFYGPPGTGKTMLARALVGILPPLSHEASLEVTGIHSVAGVLSQDWIGEPPFRAPHHTASYASIIGGGTNVRPGEVTLAHRGVLFLDEFPEFHRDVINALRQPLEDRVVSVARARGTYTFPAQFMLVAALNPCPCGFAGSSRCTCLPIVIEKYRKKVSGPIADRIDMWVEVGEIAPENLSVHTKRAHTNETEATRARVVSARKKQQERFSTHPTTTGNASMSARDIETLALITPESETLLVQAAKKLHLSSRGYHRTIKLARTIADLAGSTNIKPEHMLEALQYRQRS